MNIQHSQSSRALAERPPHYKLWVMGMRPRTWPIACSSALCGISSARLENTHIHVINSALCLGISLCLTIGVNYANDYSDGIKGTDDNRQGPIRLVGSRLVEPRYVKYAAIFFLAVASVLGIIVAANSSWLLLLPGIFAVLAAWTYTGGPIPYGYRGYGEVMAALFFGLVGVSGTEYATSLHFSTVGFCAMFTVGALSAAVLVTNNLRDIDEDVTNMKYTLAVRLGRRKTQLLYSILMIIPFISAGVMMLIKNNIAFLLLFLALLPAIKAVHCVVYMPTQKRLVNALQWSSYTLLFWSIVYSSIVWF